MNKETRILALYAMADDICKACKTRHECDNTTPCAMAEIVAEELTKKGYVKANEQISSKED